MKPNTEQGMWLNCCVTIEATFEDEEDCDSATPGMLSRTVAGTSIVTVNPQMYISRKVIDCHS